MASALHDPKGPPQLLALEGALDAEGKIAAWRTDMWLPRATANLPNVPLLAPDAAGIAQPQGLSAGLISQNGDPPYAVPHQEVQVHWLKSSPLRPRESLYPITWTGKVEYFLMMLETWSSTPPLPAPMVVSRRKNS